jgi:hypothetical protein
MHAFYEEWDGRIIDFAWLMVQIGTFPAKCRQLHFQPSSRFSQLSKLIFVVHTWRNQMNLTAQQVTTFVHL